MAALLWEEVEKAKAKCARTNDLVFGRRETEVGDGDRAT